MFGYPRKRGKMAARPAAEKLPATEAVMPGAKIDATPHEGTSHHAGDTLRGRTQRRRAGSPASGGAGGAAGATRAVGEGAEHVDRRDADPSSCGG